MRSWYSVPLMLLSTTLLARPPFPAAHSPGGGSTDLGRERGNLEAEYRFLQAELSICEAGIPYLVLDLERGIVTMKLKGTVIWNSSFNMDSGDTLGITDFARRFYGPGSFVARPITHKHLFAASMRIPDEELDIISRVTNAPPEEIQRSIPERFLISWDGGCTLEITTDLEGRRVSVLRNAFEELRWILRSPLGDIHIPVRMEPVEALTLYHATALGMPTLLSPVEREFSRVGR